MERHNLRSFYIYNEDEDKRYQFKLTVKIGSFTALELHVCNVVQLERELDKLALMCNKYEVVDCRRNPESSNLKKDGV